MSARKRGRDDGQEISARDVFLTIALAVARDGLPVPDQISIRPAEAYDGAMLPNRVDVSYDYRAPRPVPDVLADAEQAAKVLRLTDFYEHPDQFVRDWSQRRQGWRWQVSASTPAGTPYTPGTSRTKPADPLGDALAAAVTGTARRGGGTRG